MIRPDILSPLSSYHLPDQSAKQNTPSLKEILTASKNFLTKTKDAAVNFKTAASLTFELSEKFAGIVADIVSQKPEDLPRAATRALVDTGIAQRHQKFLRQHPGGHPDR